MAAALHRPSESYSNRSPRWHDHVVPSLGEDGEKLLRNAS